MRKPEPGRRAASTEVQARQGTIQDQAYFSEELHNGRSLGSWYRSLPLLQRTVYAFL